MNEQGAGSGDDIALPSPLPAQPGVSGDVESEAAKPAAVPELPAVEDPVSPVNLRDKRSADGKGEDDSELAGDKVRQEDRRTDGTNTGGANELDNKVLDDDDNEILEAETVPEDSNAISPTVKAAIDPMVHPEDTPEEIDRKIGILNDLLPEQIDRSKAKILKEDERTQALNSVASLQYKIAELKDKKKNIGNQGGEPSQPAKPPAPLPPAAPPAPVDSSAIGEPVEPINPFQETPADPADSDFSGLDALNGVDTSFLDGIAEESPALNAQQELTRPPAQPEPVETIATADEVALPTNNYSVSVEDVMNSADEEKLTDFIYERNEAIKNGTFTEKDLEGIPSETIKPEVIAKQTPEDQKKAAHLNKIIKFRDRLIHLNEKVNTIIEESLQDGIEPVDSEEDEDLVREAKSIARDRIYAQRVLEIREGNPANITPEYIEAKMIEKGSKAFSIDKINERIDEIKSNLFSKARPTLSEKIKEEQNNLLSALERLQSNIESVKNNFEKVREAVTIKIAEGKSAEDIDYESLGLNKDKYLIYAKRKEEQFKNKVETNQTSNGRSNQINPTIRVRGQLVNVEPNIPEVIRDVDDIFNEGIDDDSLYMRPSVPPNNQADPQSTTQVTVTQRPDDNPDGVEPSAGPVESQGDQSQNGPLDLPRVEAQPTNDDMDENVQKLVEEYDESRKIEKELKIRDQDLVFEIVNKLRDAGTDSKKTELINEYVQFKKEYLQKTGKLGHIDYYLEELPRDSDFSDLLEQTNLDLIRIRDQVNEVTQRALLQGIDPAEFQGENAEETEFVREAAINFLKNSEDLITYRSEFEDMVFPEYHYNKLIVRSSSKQEAESLLKQDAEKFRKKLDLLIKYGSDISDGVNPRNNMTFEVMYAFGLEENLDLRTIEENISQWEKIKKHKEKLNEKNSSDHKSKYSFEIEDLSSRIKGGKDLLEMIKKKSQEKKELKQLLEEKYGSDQNISVYITMSKQNLEDELKRPFGREVFGSQLFNYLPNDIKLVMTKTIYDANSQIYSNWKKYVVNKYVSELLNNKDDIYYAEKYFNPENVPEEIKEDIENLLAAKNKSHQVNLERVKSLTRNDKGNLISHAEFDFSAYEDKANEYVNLLRTAVITDDHLDSSKPKETGLKRVVAIFKDRALESDIKEDVTGLRYNYSRVLKQPVIKYLSNWNADLPVGATSTEKMGYSIAKQIREKAGIKGNSKDDQDLLQAFLKDHRVDMKDGTIIDLTEYALINMFIK